MDRRAFLAGATALLGAPLGAAAQQPARVFRLGLLGTVPLTNPGAARIWGGFFEGLQQLGYVEGQNIVIEGRFSEGRSERLPTLAAELVRLKVASQTKAAQKTAKSLGIEMDVAPVHNSQEYEAAFSAIVKQRASGLFVVSNPTFFGDQERLAALATRNRLPMMCEWREMAEAGCLMAYGPIISDLYRRAAEYVDKILKGAKPADLPVEQPTKFELVINFKTAKAFGLTIPPSLLQRADQVIE
jgi:hypothetical protein